MAESGQQTPVRVVAAEGQAERYVVMDGYKGILLMQAATGSFFAKRRSRAIPWRDFRLAAVLAFRLTVHSLLRMEFGESSALGKSDPCQLSRTDPGL